MYTDYMGRPANRPAQFWKRVDKTAGPSACWLWTGFRYASGYGRADMNWKQWLAHRLAYYLTHGAIPDGTIIRHTCDTPSCCNPKHLIAGTQKDNIRDMDIRQRRAKGFRKPRFTGERNIQAKLTEKIVRSIRASSLTNTELARQYGVHKNCIRSARLRLTWKYFS